MNDIGLEPMPGNPGWLQSGVFADCFLDIELNALEQEREGLSKQLELLTYHVFSGINPDEDIKPPPGWIEARKEASLRSMAENLPPELAAEFSGFDNVHFRYYPVRIFVVPVTETGSVIRHFRVGTNGLNGQDLMDSLERLAATVDAMSRIVPVSITKVSEGDLHMVFARHASRDDVHKLRMLLLFDEEKADPMGLGWTGYLNGWNDSGLSLSRFLEDTFFTDQRIRLGWG